MVNTVLGYMFIL